MTEFQVRRDALTETRLAQTPAPGPLQEGEIHVAVERFAFTANNVTYGVVGDQIGYWRFFPARGAAAEGWGVLPVWGFGRVVASAAPEVPEGERLYGYFPPAHDLVMGPLKVSASRVVDGAAHRAALPPAYNAYQRVAAEPGYDPAHDDRRALLYPLHLTSFCLWDALKAADWRGAERVLIASASSKTSIGLAYALSQDEAAPPAIALTSARNRAFVEGLGYYAEVVEYDALDALDPAIPSVIVDMAGSGAVVAAALARLGDNLKYHLQVGLTHWDAPKAVSGLDASRSAFFFAPGHIETRVKEWGAAGFAERSGGFLRSSVAESARWLKVRSLNGLGALQDLFSDICAGRLAAEDGVVVTP